jgi:hypothetical protein
MQKAAIVLVLCFALLMGVVLNDISYTGHFVQELNPTGLADQPWVLMISLVALVFVLISLTYVELYKHLNKQ